MDLRRFYHRKARLLREIFARRLRSGRGVGGRRLLRKDRRDGRPLGGSLPSALRRGRIRVSQHGFLIDYSRERKLLRFHNGTRGGRQEPRPVFGLTQPELLELRDDARDEVARQLNRGVR